MKNKQVLAYGLLVSRNDLRSIFVGHIHFMKRVFLQCQYTRTIFKNKNLGQSLLTTHLKFQNFNEIFYGDDQTQKHKFGFF